MPDNASLIDLATAISDGAPIDWPAVESSMVDQSDRVVIGHLRVIAEIVALQERLAAAHTSIADELREAAKAAPDRRESLPSWGPLRLIELVGHGAFGEVYRAWDPRLDREVALKLLRRSQSRRRAGSFLIEEGRLLAKIRHPNVITVYGAERIGDHVGIWMELIEGHTLAQLVGASGPFEPSDVTGIGIDLCRAVAAVHRAGLLHRDIKAHNVMRDADGRIVLMDFGAGRDLPVDRDDVAGTPLYLAPEIFERRDATAQSDIYSLGVLLYQLATGTYPVMGSTFGEIRDRHRRGDRRPLSSGRVDLPPAFIPVVERALAPDPAARFESAAAMEAALAAMTESARVPARRRLVPRAVAWTVALVAVIAVVSAARLRQSIVGESAGDSAPQIDRSSLVVHRMNQPEDIAFDRTPSPGAAGAMTVRRVWSGPDVINTSLSADVRLASFPDWETGNLAVHDFATGRTRRLTNRPSWFESDEYAEASLISPDDSQVAYTWSNTQGLYELRLIGIEGGSPRVVYRNEEVIYIRPAEWSPDGKSILALLSGKGGTNQMALVSIPDGSVRVLKTFDWRSPAKMSFSPDGRYIAYDFPPREDSRNRDVYVLATDGSRDTPLVAHPANDTVLGWAPDGRTILFSSDRTGVTAAWMIRVADGKPVGSPELVRPDMGRSWGIRFTRDGSYYYGVATALTDIYIADLDGATGKLLAAQVPASQRFIGSNAWPEWSPDGSYLAYVSQSRPGGAPETSVLSVLALDSGEIREIVPRLNYFQRLRWSPDGRSILVHGRDPKNRGGLFLVDVQSGAVTPVVMSGPDQGGYPREAAWMPDGKAIVYMHFNSLIFLRDLQSGQERPVYDQPSVFALSPDGRWLVVAEDDRSSKTSVLKLVKIGQGLVRELARSSTSGGFSNNFRWSPDGRHVFYIKGPPNSPRTELWRISVESAESQRLGVVVDGARHLAVHPDGRRVAFSAGTFKGELWVMENFLPARGRSDGVRGR